MSINATYSDNAQGVYTWVNPNPNYAIAKDYKCFVGGAMPGFWDYYKEGEGRYRLSNLQC